MSLTRSVVGRPTTIFVAFALLIALGLFSATNLAVDLYPEIEPPVIVVFTGYRGAGPEEIEKSVTRPLESALSNTQGIEKITSTSSAGSSMVMLEFTYGTDMAEAANGVRDNLEFVKRLLPTEAESPLIFKFDPSMIPIMGLMVSGNRSPEELRELAEKVIQPRIEQVPGVALAGVNGGRQRVVRVETPLERLEAYGLTVNQIVNMLRGQNVQVAAGSIVDGNLDYLLTAPGEYKTIEEIGDVVVAYRGGGYDPARGAEPPRKVLLRDIAEVFEGYRDEDNLVYVNGKPAVQITVQKQSGKNSVQTAAAVRARLERLAGELPPGVQVTELFNTTDIIQNSIRNVANSARDGALLAVVILFIFLRSWKPTLVIGLTIPISLLFTLMIMYFAGLTLNIMTLAGLALGVGMLVDNSIVILENIYRYREKGSKLKISAVLGTQEMTMAIMASTLTTICVFTPLIMFGKKLDVVGELFSGLAFTVVISLATSIAVAVLLIPVLSSHYLPLVTRKQKPLKYGAIKAVDGAMQAFFDGLDKAYRRGVTWVMRHKLVTIGVIAAVFVGTMAYAPRVGFVFMPPMEQDAVVVNLEMPLGTRLPETEAALRRFEEIIEAEVRGYNRIVLQAGDAAMFGLGAKSKNRGSLRIMLPPFERRIDSSDAIKEKLRAHFGEFPSAVFSFGSDQGGFGGGSPIDVIIKTEDLALAKRTAEAVRDLIRREIPEITEPSVDLKDGLPQVEIRIDRQRAYDLSLNVYGVANEIKAAVDGVNATKYRSGDSEYDILVVLPEADRSELPALDRLFVTNPAGLRVPLAAFASYEKGAGPIDIKRENQARVVHVTAGLRPGVSLDQAERRMRELIAREIPYDDAVIIEYGGDYRQFLEYGGTFALIVAAAALLVFGVMASQFESFLDPFIILFTIPLSFTGVVWIYALTGDIFNILTAVGLLVLVGVIVNNGIVLVDYTNLLRKRGLKLEEAVITAAGNRLRPILMTTLTTILALMPLAFYPGEGTELVAPIGKTVLGGLSFGTLMTLFLMPAVYAVFNRHSDARAAKRDRRLNRIAAGGAGKEAAPGGAGAPAPQGDPA
jgi:HAE1 family hydrophobic/amphiphilic exporter-1